MYNIPQRKKMPHNPPNQTKPNPSDKHFTLENKTKLKKKKT